MVSKRVPHEVDLREWQAKFPPSHFNDGSMGVVTPFDMPTYVRAHRLMQDTEDNNPPSLHSTALKGFTLEVDAFTFGVKVFIRLGMDGTLRVFVQDSDGTEKVADYSKE